MVLTPIIELSTEKPLDFFKIPRIFPHFVVSAMQNGVIEKDSIDASKTSGQQLSSLVTQAFYFGRKDLPFIQFLTKDGWVSYWLETDLDKSVGKLVTMENRRNEVYYYTEVKEPHPVNDFCHWASVRFGHWCDFPFIDFIGMAFHHKLLQVNGISHHYGIKPSEIMKGHASLYLGASSAKFIIV